MAEINSKNVKYWLLALLLAVFCSPFIGMWTHTQGYDAPTPESTSSATPDIWTSMAKSAILQQLKDPSSADFRNVFYSPKGAVCGQVNSKNSFGGYVGYKSFIYAKGLLIMQEGSGAKSFRKSWNTACASK